MFALFAASASPAFADSSAYELYCPGTPVGNIVLNGVVTTGTITAASGSTFNLTNYQSTVSLPSSIVSAAAALGNSSIAGSATLKVDATGATPASVAAPPITINAPIPSPVPTTGLSLVLPSTPGTVGPFTSSGGTVTLTVDPTIGLSLNVSGSTLTLTCTPYPNNSAATGIVSAAPTAAKASPVIATGTVGGGATPTTAAPTATPTTAAPTGTPTTAAPATQPSSLATTGPGPHLWLVAVIGFIVLYLGSVVLALVERPRSLLRRFLHLAPPAVPATAGAAPAGPVQRAETGPPVERSIWTEAPSAKPAYPKAGGSPGLWFDGWEPQSRNRG
jgi:hypothetical protein